MQIIIKKWKTMKILNYFFTCYFHQQAGFDALEDIIREFKKDEQQKQQIKFIAELQSIIYSKGYKQAQRVMKKYGNRILDIDETEKIIQFFYDKLTDTPTHVKGIDFEGPDKKIIFCPVCTPNIEKATTFSLINKATVIQNSQQIYICKPCKLVWFSEDNIKAANATPYKKFMRTLGLKGLWRELSDVDVL
jgi:hypothetical protein